MRSWTWLTVTIMAAVVAGSIVLETESLVAAQQQPPGAAVDRARKTIQMLDGIYKQAVVLITDKYVNDTSDFAAGSAAVLWFDAITKGGTHQVRLIDATGDPNNPANVAQNAFEREGIRQLREGEAYYEQVVNEDGQFHLRAVTAVPVVMEKCVMCHAHYSNAAEGLAIGAISYRMPIE